MGFRIAEDLKKDVESLAIKMTEEDLDITELTFENNKIKLYVMKANKARSAYQEGLVISEVLEFEDSDPVVVLRDKPKGL